MGAEVTFKAGDRVRCVDAGPNGFLRKGEVYVVTYCERADDEYSSIKVAGSEQGYFITRFELAEPEVAPQPSIVHRPSHYARFEIEPIEFIMRNKLEFWQGNVIKYVMRYDAKDGIQDLRKAARYIEMQIKKLEGNTEFAK